MLFVFSKPRRGGNKIKLEQPVHAQAGDSPEPIVFAADGHGRESHVERQDGRCRHGIHQAIHAERREHGLARVLIHFYGYSTTSYTVQYRNSVSSGAWAKLQNVFPAGNGPVEIVDTILPGNPARFYRLFSPATP